MKFMKIPKIIIKTVVNKLISQPQVANFASVSELMTT